MSTAHLAWLKSSYSSGEGVEVAAAFAGVTGRA